MKAIMLSLPIAEAIPGWAVAFATCGFLRQQTQTMMSTTMMKTPPPTVPPTVLAVLPPVATDVDNPVEDVEVMLELVLNIQLPDSST